MARVLLVDDDPQVRMMLSESLRLEGYEVDEATNGREAVERFRRQPPDLVIMDIIMPERDGVEAMHVLRKEFPGARVIAISGGSANIRGEYLLGTAQAIGAARTFSKPVDMAELLGAIAELVEEGNGTASDREGGQS